MIYAAFLYSNLYRSCPSKCPSKKNNPPIRLPLKFRHLHCSVGIPFFRSCCSGASCFGTSPLPLQTRSWCGRTRPTLNSKFSIPSGITCSIYMLFYLRVRLTNSNATKVNNTTSSLCYPLTTCVGTVPLFFSRLPKLASCPRSRSRKCRDLDSILGVC